MRPAVLLALLVSVAALVGALVRNAQADVTLLTAGVAGAPPVNSTTSMAFTCVPFNLFNPDGGPNGVPTCSTGQQAIKIETESTTAVHLCGKTGCTQGNYATVGFKRCVGCNNGSVYEIAGNRYTTRCIASTADAGVDVVVMCASY